MELTHLLLLLIIPFLFISTIFYFFIYIYRTKTNNSSTKPNDLESAEQLSTSDQNDDLICFQGGENLTISDILDAPGEVIAKSSYATLYKASLVKENGDDHCVLLLRFLRPTCSGSVREIVPYVHAIGLVRHVHLVPLYAFYIGSRGEKLLVHPFYPHLTLDVFIKDGSKEYRKWNVIYNICLGLVKGLAHLHCGLHKPIIHGNLKSKNVLLGRDFEPYISDYGLHLLLNQNTAQEMLESLAAQGYKAPELMKVKDVCESTDIYSLGIVLLELITGKQPINSNAASSQEFYLPNFIRSAILDHRIHDLYHPDIVVNLTGKQRHRVEDRVLKLVQLAMACCSPSPSLRPHASEVVRKVEEIGK